MSVCLYADDLKSVEAGARAGAKTICFEPRVSPHPDEGSAEAENARMVSECRAALDMSRAHNVRLIWKCPVSPGRPRLMQSDCSCPVFTQQGLARAWRKTREPLSLWPVQYPGLALAGSWGLNIFNA